MNNFFIIFLTFIFSLAVAKTTAKESDYSFTISKKLINEQLQDLDKILKQAASEKIQNKDGNYFYRITKLPSDGIYAKLGIKEQDIIKKINNQPILHEAQIIMLLAQFQALSNFSLTIERKGADRNHEYRLIP